MAGCKKATKKMPPKAMPAFMMPPEAMPMKPPKAMPKAKGKKKK